MMRINEPGVSFQQTLETCKKGIERNNSLLNRITDGDNELQHVANKYYEFGSSGKLYTIKPLNDVDGVDTVVVASLTKSELIKLYEYYFRDKEPGRDLYEKLLVSTNEKCPFCGGIGITKNLDHYLPKYHFPQFSVLPLNLIPSCRDCNMDGKGKSYAATADVQVIHPYLDNDRFFNEQWIFATYTHGTREEPSVIQYFVNPPEHWSDVDNKRACHHFQEFDIAKRYLDWAAPTVIEVEAQIRASVDFYDIDVFKQIILQPVVDAVPFANHWKRVMYLALIEGL